MTYPATWHPVRLLPGPRLVLLAPYVFIQAWYFQHEPSIHTFIGMPRSTVFAGESPIALNMPALSFMIFGVALAFEQPSDYLCHPNWMVAIRNRRSIRRFLEYLLLVLAYAAVFTIPHLAFSLLVITKADAASIIPGAWYAWWSLSVTLTIANIGYMTGNRAMGYLLAILPHLAIAGISGLWALLAEYVPHTAIPVWVPVLALFTCVSIAVNVFIFYHRDII